MKVTSCCEDKFQFDFYDQISVPSCPLPTNGAISVVCHSISSKSCRWFGVWVTSNTSYGCRYTRWENRRIPPSLSTASRDMELSAHGRRNHGDLSGTRYFHIGGDEPFLLVPRCAAMAAANGRCAADYLNRAWAGFRIAAACFWADVYWRIRAATAAARMPSPWIGITSRWRCGKRVC